MRVMRFRGMKAKGGLKRGWKQTVNLEKGHFESRLGRKSKGTNTESLNGIPEKSIQMVLQRRGHSVSKIMSWACSDVNSNMHALLWGSKKLSRRSSLHSVAFESRSRRLYGILYGNYDFNVHSLVSFNNFFLFPSFRSCVRSSLFITCDSWAVFHRKICLTLAHREKGWN